MCKQHGSIVEILFPKESLRARALEKIPPHEIEVSEEVSIFHKERKNQETLGYRIRDDSMLLKFQFFKSRDMTHSITLKFCLQIFLIHFR